MQIYVAKGAEEIASCARLLQAVSVFLIGDVNVIKMKPCNRRFNEAMSNVHLDVLFRLTKTAY